MQMLQLKNVPSVKRSIKLNTHRQRQIASNHAGLLFYDADNDPSGDLGMGDDTNIAEIDIRLRNKNSADTEGDVDERLRLKVTRKESSGTDGSITERFHFRSPF